MTTSSNPDPPSYEAVTGHEPRHSLPTGELTTLILDGCLIYPAIPPSRALYELTNPPSDAKTKVYGVEKLTYKLSATDGEGSIRRHRDHLYDFKTNYFGMTSNHMVVEGKASRRRAFQKVFISPCLGRTTWKVRGHFKIEQKLLGHLTHDKEVLWKDETGNLLAVEMKSSRKEDDTLDDLPRLNFKTQMDEKTMDLLVACWAAQVWKEAQKDLAEPMTWERCKSPSLQKHAELASKSISQTNCDHEYWEVINNAYGGIFRGWHLI